MNPFGYLLYWLLALLLASCVAALACFAGGYGYPWLGVSGVVCIIGIVIFVFWTLSDTRFT